MISLLNDWSAQWAPWFLAAVIQNTIFLALVFGALYLLREASARIRTLIATVGVIKLVLPPLVPSHWLMGPATEGPTTAVATLLFPFAEDGAAETARGAGWTGGLELLTVLMLVWAIVAVSRLGWSVMQTVDLALAVRGSVPVPAAEVPTEIRDHGLEVRLCERIDIPLTMASSPGAFSCRPPGAAGRRPSAARCCATSWPISSTATAWSRPWRSWPNPCSSSIPSC